MNKLSGESSPYLLQHAHNPVNWHPWGNEALEIARQEDKLLLISIGYTACHWCHVMERESFEDKEVAEIMNQHFVCIKVDREERPDVDHLYMSAVQLTGSGGWPLNCFALPNGTPVYGGTYFSREAWMEVLQYIANLYTKQRDKLLTQGDQILQAISEISQASSGKAREVEKLPDPEEMAENILKEVDRRNGGTVGAPKFPMPSVWSFLLRQNHLNRNPEALVAATLTLDQMASGGIYDQLGGGFARYSTDNSWHIPHFEKMLYDNAQLIMLYCEAFRLIHKARYCEVVMETIGFVKRELTSPQGLFYAALDADSEGIEGKYYSWTKNELDNIAGEHAPLGCNFYGVTQEGNWEDGINILYQKGSSEALKGRYNLNEATFWQRLAEIRRSMLSHREQRARPITDTKILTSWNALMIKALAEAFKTFGEKSHLEMALTAAGNITENALQTQGNVLRSFVEGQKRVSGFLDDYAHTIEAFISLYHCTLDEDWLGWADKMTGYTLIHFYDLQAGLFWYTDGDTHNLIARQKEVSDNVIPSSNAVMADNLFNLGNYFGNASYLKIARNMASTMAQQVRGYPTYYARWASLMQQLIYQSGEVIIVGTEAAKIVARFSSLFLPGLLLAGSEKPSTLPLLANRFKEGSTLIYVCNESRCHKPVKTVEEALELIGKIQQ